MRPSRLDGSDPFAAWARAKTDHPAPGEVVATAQAQLDELETFIQRQDLVSLPASAHVQVAPTPRFYRWTFASMWTPGAVRGARRCAPTTTSPTPIRPGRPSARKSTCATSTTARSGRFPIHEVFPGHFLHYQHLRRLTSTLRKSILFSSAAMVEGWAHYAEHMMVEAGFRRQDPASSSASWPSR